MTTCRLIGIVAAIGVFTLAVSCESDEGQDNGGSLEGGAETDSTLSCGGSPCSAATGAEFSQVTVCCTDTDSCGLQAPFVSHCLAASQPGAFDVNCASFTPSRGEMMDGCCGPNGCGALNPFMGCISNADLGRDPVDCAYDPTNDCASVTSISCDGAEDCAAGEHCCAKTVSSMYVEFGCFASCEALQADAGTATWFEFCHDGDACEDPAATCHTTSSLPASLGRCSVTGFRPPPTGTSNADEVNCGTDVCGAGEQCCLRPPYEPYCTPDTEDCRCHPPNADGGSAADASGGDGG